MEFGKASAPTKKVTDISEIITEVSTLPSQSLSQSLNASSNSARFSTENLYFYIFELLSIYNFK
jgi:hypothetical protein